MKPVTMTITKRGLTALRKFTADDATPLMGVGVYRSGEHIILSATNRYIMVMWTDQRHEWDALRKLVGRSELIGIIPRDAIYEAGKMGKPTSVIELTFTDRGYEIGLQDDDDSAVVRSWDDYRRDGHKISPWGTNIRKDAGDAPIGWNPEYLAIIGHLGADIGCELDMDGRRSSPYPLRYMGQFGGSTANEAHMCASYFYARSAERRESYTNLRPGETFSIMVLLMPFRLNN